MGNRAFSFPGADSARSAAVYARRIMRPAIYAPVNRFVSDFAPVTDHIYGARGGSHLTYVKLGANWAIWP